MKKAYAVWFAVRSNQRGSGASDSLTSTAFWAGFSSAAGGWFPVAFCCLPLEIGCRPLKTAFWEDENSGEVHIYGNRAVCAAEFKPEFEFGRFGPRAAIKYARRACTPGTPAAIR
jgi:hypothetical protein